MTRKGLNRIRERHILVDALGMAAGGFFVDTVKTHAWNSFAFTIICIAALVAIDYVSIDNEEHPEKHLKD